MTPMQKAREAFKRRWQAKGVLTLDAAIEASLNEALASFEAEGWKLMPREATEEILQAIHRANMAQGSIEPFARSKRVYTATFDAAPKPE